MYEVEFTKKSLKEIKNIDRNIAKILISKIKKISQKPQRRDLDIKKLKGFANAYRLRHGEYRVIYEINNNKLLIKVIKIGVRGGMYA